MLEEHRQAAYGAFLRARGLVHERNGDAIMAFHLGEDSQEDSAGDGEVLIYGPIVSDGEAEFLRWLDIDAVSGSMFRERLASVEGDVLVRVNSIGGEIQEASVIMQAISERIESGDKVNVVIDGFALSAASLVTLSASHVAMSRLGEIMIHGPQASGFGDIRAFEKLIKRMQSMESNLTNLYAERMGLSEEEAGQLLADETWYTAPQALEAGLVDEVVDVAERNAGDGGGESGEGDEGTVTNSGGSQMGVPVALVGDPRNRQTGLRFQVSPDKGD